VPHLYGPLTRLGLITAVVIGALDQAVKFWLMVVFQIGDRGVVHLTPFLDLVLTWNRGISYGLFQQEGDLGRYVLLALVIGAVIALCIWLASAESRLMAVSLGLIIGGAVGNAIDRLHWPGVMDFVLFHITTPTFNFTWYVFNLADAAIVAGVAGLLYESLVGGGVPQKRPDPPG
jgi:signal peptidase II